MLGWFVENYSVESAMLHEASSLGTLTAKHIKAGRVSNAFRDQNIDVHRIKKYFDKDGWLAILKTMEDKEKEAWSCSVCLQALDHEQIGCDSCLEWYHLNCAGLNKIPKSKKWFCISCYSSI